MGDISNWDVSKVEDMANLFKNSKFTKDISDWKPYSLTNGEEMFSECHAPIPYWAKIENLEQRNKAIEIYHLNRQLNNELSENNNISKKMKI
jgi:hypothetical protein